MIYLYQVRKLREMKCCLLVVWDGGNMNPMVYAGGGSMYEVDGVSFDLDCSYLEVYFSGLVGWMMIG